MEDTGERSPPATGPGAARIFRCLAVTSATTTGPALIGHEFIARLNPSRTTLTWCKNNSPPAHPETTGALALGLATPLSPACTRP